jgi:hypothetical protein
MTTMRRSFFAFRLPRRLLVVGLALIGAAAAAALAFNLSPTGRALAHYREGARLSCCGEPDPVAVKHFRTALRLDPQLFDARRGLAGIYVSDLPAQAGGICSCARKGRGAQCSCEEVFDRGGLRAPFQGSVTRRSVWLAYGSALGPRENARSAHSDSVTLYPVADLPTGTRPSTLQGARRECLLVNRLLPGGCSTDGGRLPPLP